jgi:hypothetical protein
VYNDTSFSVDKHLKLDKPLGTVYMSTEACPIKFLNTAPSKNMRADELAIETAKTGKVTAVVAVMSIFCRKKCKSWDTNPGNKKHSCQMAESSDFLGGFSCKLKNLSQKTRNSHFSKISA